MTSTYGKWYISIVFGTKKWQLIARKHLLHHVETPNICFHKVIKSISQEHVWWQNVTLQDLKREKYKGARMGPWDCPSYPMTPFHRTTGRDILFHCIVRTCRGGIRTFVRPGFVGRTVPPSARPPCHHTGTETEGRAVPIPCINSFVPICLHCFV